MAPSERASVLVRVRVSATASSAKNRPERRESREIPAKSHGRKRPRFIALAADISGAHTWRRETRGAPMEERGHGGRRVRRVDQALGRRRWVGTGRCCPMI